MMYQSKFVVCLKHQGKVLREYGDKVYVPFGSEYTVYLKNLDTRRCMVNVFIDGVNATPNGLVVPGLYDVDLERFISNNLVAGNRFKFVERTGAIEKHRGVGCEDGLIRVEFQYEREIQPDYYTPKKLFRNYGDSNYHDNHKYYTNSGGVGSSLGNIVGASLLSGNVYGSGEGTLSASVESLSNDVGVTVPGSISEQAFTTVSSFRVEHEKHIIILHILGDTGQEKVTKPFTVKKRYNCSVCGKANHYNSKFCNECGASLEFVIRN